MPKSTPPPCPVCGTTLDARKTKQGDLYLQCESGCCQLFAKSLKAKKAFKEMYGEPTSEEAPPASRSSTSAGDAAAGGEPARGRGADLDELYR